MMEKKRNTKGLVQNQERTPSERRESAQKAGFASGEARKKRKALKELMEIALQMEEQNEGYRSMMKKAGWKDMDQMSVITQGLIQRAKTGDVQAYNAIRDIIGEKPAEKMEVSGDQQMNLTVTCITKSPDDFNFPHSEAEVDAER